MTELTNPYAGGVFEESSVVVRYGESYVVPKGFSGTWEMVGEVFRELIVIEPQTLLEDLGSP